MTNQQTDEQLDEIFDNKPVSNVPDDIWGTLHGTWTGLWTDAYGEWDERQASDLFPISDLLSEERLQWLKANLIAWKNHNRSAVGKAQPTHNPIPPDGCTCGALWTVRGKHGKPDCPYLAQPTPLPEYEAELRKAGHSEEHIREIVDGLKDSPLYVQPQPPLETKSSHCECEHPAYMHLDDQWRCNGCDCERFQLPKHQPQPALGDELRQAIWGVIPPHGMFARHKNDVCTAAVPCRLCRQCIDDIFGLTHAAAQARDTQAAKVPPFDAFDFVTPCEPDCSAARHARHKVQWDMAERINVAQGLPPNPTAAAEIEKMWELAVLDARINETIYWFGSGDHEPEKWARKDIIERLESLKQQRSAIEQKGKDE